MIPSYKNHILALFFVCVNLNANLTDSLYTQKFGVMPDCDVTVQTKPESRRPNIKVSPAPSVREGSIGHGINPWNQHNQMMNEILGHQQIIKPNLTLESCKQYFAWQMHGDVKQLKKHRHVLKRKLRLSWFWQKPHIQQHINFITDILNAPLTKALDAIKNGSLNEAVTALHKLEVQFGCAEGMFQLTQKAYDEAAKARMVNGFDCIDAARALFKERADYPEFLERKCKQQEEEHIRAEESKISVQHYQLDGIAIQLIDQHGLEHEAFTKFSGNKPQQAIHQQYITIVNAATELYTNHLDNNSVRQLTESTIEFADIGREYNKQGFIKEALCVADFCWKLVHYTKEIVIGTCEGAHFTIEQTAEMILHPIDTVFGITDTMISVGDALFHLILEHNELAMLYESDPELGLEKAQEIREKYKPIREAIKKEIADMELRDWSKLATNAVTASLLQKRLLSTAGSFFKKSKNRLLAYAQKVSNALQEEQLAIATADGQVLKVADGPGNEGSLIGNRGRRLNNKNKLEYEKASTPSLQNANEPFNFTNTAATHMEDPDRFIPIQILRMVIEDPLHILKDGQGTNAFMYYAQMIKNKQLYNVEVLYNSELNQIMHFLYRRNRLGPLPKVKQ